MSSLIYVFDSIDEIPVNILKALGLHDNINIQDVKRMLERFKVFRLEKMLIKKLKQKT